MLKNSTLFECSYSLISNPNLSIEDKCILSNQCEYSYINILSLNFCYMNDLRYITYTLIILFIVFCFYFISDTSNKYLVPVLGIICDNLHLSQNLAGLTLLAFGNQAPDLFVALIAGNDDKEGAETALSSLLGSELLITGVVLSLVIYHGKDIKVLPSNYIRDFSVFLLSIGLIGVFGYFEVIYLWESICFFLIYFVYVAACLMMDKQQLKNKNKKMEVELTKQGDQSDDNDNYFEVVVYEKETIDDDYYYKKEDFSTSNNSSLVHSSENKVEENSLYTQFQYKKVELLINKKANLDAKIKINCKAVLCYILLSPLDLIRILTIPPYKDSNWNKIVFLFIPITLPSFFFYVIDVFPILIAYWEYTIGFYSLMILLIILFYFKTYKYSLPPCRCCLLIIAFIMSIIWLWFMTNLLMDTIFAIKMLLPIDIPQGFINMTAVAFGNSLPDLMVGISLSKSGFAEMAFSGSIGAPVFAMLFGFGMSLIKKNITSYEIPFQLYDFDRSICKLLVTAIGCLSLNIIRLLVQGCISGFRMKRWTSIFGFVIYLLFIVIICYLTFI